MPDSFAGTVTAQEWRKTLSEAVTTARRAAGACRSVARNDFMADASLRWTTVNGRFFGFWFCSSGKEGQTGGGGGGGAPNNDAQGQSHMSMRG